MKGPIFHHLLIMWPEDGLDSGVSPRRGHCWLKGSFESCSLCGLYWPAVMERRGSIRDIWPLHLSHKSLSDEILCLFPLKFDLTMICKFHTQEYCEGKSAFNIFFHSLAHFHTHFMLDFFFSVYSLSQFSILAYCSICSMSMAVYSRGHLIVF